MPHTDNNQPEFNRKPDSTNRQKSQLLSRDIESLQAGMRVDFDQKLGELANLLARFKAMVAAPDSNAANDDAKPDEIITSVAANVTANTEVSDLVNEHIEEDSSATVPTNVLKSATESSEASAANDAPVQQPTSTKPFSLYTAEPARFESGLYKLNCQLYRFRLELDQEMEFREEPLHIHFHQESELSKILQKISDKSSEINPDSY